MTTIIIVVRDDSVKKDEFDIMDITIQKYCFNHHKGVQLNVISVWMWYIMMFLSKGLSSYLHLTVTNQIKVIRCHKKLLYK